MSESFAAPTVLTVSELNRLVRAAIERALPVTWIGGEISNLTRAPSGHWYFTLKDAQATVRCAMFRNRNQFLDWRPENGMQVEVRAQAGLYEPRGEFQLTVDAMRRAGLGALFEAFQKLKDKLEREGLFDPARKRALPEKPGRIGVVTSPRAAALRDVISTLGKRWPLAELILYPTPVQGADAPAAIAAALASAGARAECDVLLLVRGGGGIEDLWSFNDERVARTIADSPIPVVSGIGHETDFTIADFVADRRAPTPTGAAQLATPDVAEWLHRAKTLERRLIAENRRILERLGQQLDHLGRRLRHPAEQLRSQARHLDQLARRLSGAGHAGTGRAHVALERLHARLLARQPQTAHRQAMLNNAGDRLAYAWRIRLESRQARLTALAGQLGHLDPDSVLLRGYAIVRDSHGKLVTRPAQIPVGHRIDVRLADGGLQAEVCAHMPTLEHKD